MGSSKLYKKNKATIHRYLDDSTGRFNLYTKRGNGDWVLDVTFETEGYFEIENHSKYIFVGYVMHKGAIQDVEMIIDNNFVLRLKDNMENWV